MKRTRRPQESRRVLVATLREASDARLHDHRALLTSPYFISAMERPIRGAKGFFSHLQIREGAKFPQTGRQRPQTACKSCHSPIRGPGAGRSRTEWSGRAVPPKAPPKTPPRTPARRPPSTPEHARARPSTPALSLERARRRGPPSSVRGANDAAAALGLGAVRFGGDVSGAGDAPRPRCIPPPPWRNPPWPAARSRCCSSPC
jgi:hypothetical protein